MRKITKVKNFDGLSESDKATLFKLQKNVKEVTSSLFGNGVTRLNLLQATLAAMAACSKIITDHIKAIRPTGTAPACKSGCSHCCSMRVGIMPSETFTIATYLTDMFDTEELATIKQKITETARSIWIYRNDTLARWKAGIQCPFLSDGKCSIYEIRPFSCRWFTSQNADDCQSNRTVEANALIMAIGHIISNEVNAGLAQHGYRADSEMELVASLDIALNQPDAFDRFLGGDNVFADIQDLADKS